MCGSPRHKFCTASLDNAPRIDGFVFAPPDRSILIQPSEMTRFASILNWLCLATFSVPGPPQRERPDAPVPSARCCCLLRSHPSSPRIRHPPVIRPVSAIWPPPSAIRHPPSATRHSSGGTRWRRVVQFPGLPVPFRASLGHPIQRGPSFYCGKKDRHQRVTTEHAARPSRRKILNRGVTESLCKFAT